MKAVVDFEALKIQLASSETIKSWSYGEIQKPETINYRTLKPEKGGLFAEEIFGPTKDWECYCGKYKRIRYKGIICDKCGVEVTQSRVRRERMGHLTLCAPVAHIWYFKGTPSRMSLLLDISPRNLSAIIYYNQYIVLEVDKDEQVAILERLDQAALQASEALKVKVAQQMEDEKEHLKDSLKKLKEEGKGKETQEIRKEETSLKSKQAVARLKEELEAEIQNTTEIYKTVKEMVKRLRQYTLLTEDEYLKLAEYDAVSHIRVGMGAESVLEMIQSQDLGKLSEELKKEVHTAVGQRKVKATRRLRVVEGFRKSKINPEWMMFSILPVIPPDLRPMVQLSGGRFATSDLNDLYRRVINRNNRLKHLIDLGAPEIILRNEKRMLQEAVDALIDSANARATQRRTNRKPLRSLSEMLRGKQGRFRQNLLGKRVDYSGRSVIVVGPELNLNQCGLPKEMALEIFKPFVLHELIERGIAPNVKSAKLALERRNPEVFDILEEIIKNHPVLLNRAPTLHKLGIQAFYPQLIEGNAIRIHPCVCSGYNADFDGDQMAVHVPLTEQAQQEARDLMMPSMNLLKPSDGSPITLPNKDMALGCYYLTTIDEKVAPSSTIFSSPDEAEHAYQERKITLRQSMKLRMKMPNTKKTEIIETTVGRLRFNAVLPEALQYMNTPVNAGALKSIVKKAITMFDSEQIRELIDDIKRLGFTSATMSGLSVSVADCVMIEEKDTLIVAANKRVEEVQENYLQGLITQEERRRLSFQIWMETTNTIAEKTWNNFSEDNAVKVMINSGGTRASKDQVKQLAAMRGLVVDPLGKIVELPTKSNFREGLSIFEYVTSSRGSRKGLTDSALKTADAGYLTRRLVDVAHDVIVRLEDCGAEEGIEITRESSHTSPFESRILGRVVFKDVKHPKKDTVLVPAGEMIDEDLLELVKDAGVDTVWVRSPLTCEAPYGICQKCYGMDFSKKKSVEIGVPVGVMAAQSIGEPGTQLTMRVKHSGGIVGLDVTQGLPRVEELFEARIPKAVSPIANISGKVSVKETETGSTVTITAQSTPAEEREYFISKTNKLNVADGDLIHAGTQLSSGSLDVKEILQIRGMRPAQMYLLEEIQKVYTSQGIPINDVHFEVIIRKMSDKVRIETSGDTSFLPGEVIHKTKFVEENTRAMAEGGEPATAQVMILGITRASLFIDSWLSAASFMETTRVLSEAAAEGREDYLLGLKENVIIGRLIPTSADRAMME
ncbi:MAG: DNA-directed RNA polymerase subunit beta' [Microgenomates group bacterium GW2011_GWF2_45_18]|nr:MAG: DNA-directed RNA polymerase subunit beta' [Microgenomates group bacterium GW2011_GWF1_44_10]KKU01960.1 MAG: DNA-directed RNA polymerase subunit beta' [Microgenomates group bacterium GW2011_GWF2_45_18]OGJ41026.1 MAG: DNA-directed RNA polymerase subunit beta' [Candidatus Pacebacteria bacterium RIFOXYB1_FULL_44_10]HAU99055.1 DNA-directed RNA polymerase subunit beta' [Candidatus Paceibacterota bacterium]HAX01230.1 DNA-directed RNA polymerase subunit beta' [Candidatus Paceibacterota bacteriu